VGDEIEKEQKNNPIPACHPVLKKMTAGRLSPQAGLGGANNLSLPTPF
jgi:hypothetical protein